MVSISSKKNQVRVRFAPSPTGPIHIGNIRAAVFNWLFARHNGGKFILRIEDTDTERSKPEFFTEIETSLKWLGIEWDEGPFFQSKNSGLYSKSAEKLLSAGKLYPCFCSSEELEAYRKKSARASVAPVYSGKCRNLSAEEVERRKKEEPFALRFRVEGDELKYNDAIRGEVTFNLRLLGDFIVVRSNGEATYNLAAAVDDADMKITDVIRGEDHISNTAPQLLIMESLGFNKPVYAHLPLILAQDGKKLGKRHGNSSFAEIVNGGYLPEATLNFLALIGWHSKDKQEEMEVGELIKKFSLEHVAVRAAHYDTRKLEWFNRRRIRGMEPAKLLGYASRFVKRHKKEFEKLSEEKKLEIISAVKGNISRLTDLDGELAPFFEYSIAPDIKEGLAGYNVKESAGAFLPVCESDDFEKVMEAVSEKIGVKGKALYMPVRAALSGRLQGSELKYLYEFLGADERKKRLNEFIGFMNL